jgi:Rrf2 family cysteine metabolism transcriptional repressor
MRLNISTKGRYGLRAILDMALHQEKDPISLSSIADRQGLSEGYLEQLMIPLKRAGLIRSIRGAQGGYLLVKSPGEIKVGDVIRALEGPIAPVACVSEDYPEDCYRAEFCATRKVWSKVRDAVAEVLDSFTLEDLVQESYHQRQKGTEEKRTCR